MKSIRVSYILATYNREAFLPQAFVNIREFFDKARDELIVVDGGSTDRTLLIISENRDLVTSLISEPDKGEAHAFNKGFLIAAGEIIKVLTDDDYFYPDVMRKAIAVLLERDDVDALLCGGRFLNGERVSNNVVWSQHVPNGIKYSSSVLNVFDFAGCGVGLFFKRRILSVVGLFDTRFTSVDGDFIARIIEHGISVRFFRVYLFDHITHDKSGGVLHRKKIQGDWMRICIRNQHYARLIQLCSIWYVRPLIPKPLRYLWKLDSGQRIGPEWNDGNVL